MASFCPKCGSAVPDGAGFCPSCGTSIVSTSAPSNPSPVPAPVSTGYAPVNTQPSMSAAQYPTATAPAGYPAPIPVKSGSGLKIVLIIVAIVVGIGVIGVGIVGFGVYRVVHSVKNAVVTDDKGNVSLNSATTGISMGKNVTVTPDELGVPVYPGATLGDGGIRMKTKAGSMLTVVYKTSDDVDTVANFYKGKMPEAELTATGSSNATVLKSGPKNDQTMVMISPRNGSDKSVTNIVITRIKQSGN